MHTLYFDAGAFRDPPERRDQSVNGVEGYVLAHYLSDGLQAAGYLIEAVFDIDEGWAFFADLESERYKVLAAVEPVAVYADTPDDAPKGDMRAKIEITRDRGMLEQITGRKRMERDDPVTELLCTALKAHAGVPELQVAY